MLGCMNDRTRDEHLEWCKQRAREELARGDWSGAAASMISDLRKHPGTESSVEIAGALMIALVHDVNSARRFVEGFN